MQPRNEDFLVSYFILRTVLLTLNLTEISIVKTRHCFFPRDWPGECGRREGSGLDQLLGRWSCVHSEEEPGPSRSRAPPSSGGDRPPACLDGAAPWGLGRRLGRHCKQPLCLTPGTAGVFVFLVSSWKSIFPGNLDPPRKLP